MLRRFRLEEPQSVAETSELLGRFGDSAKIYAGGTELLLAMKEGLVQYERLINVKRLGLNQISAENGTVKIGALCTHHELELSPAIQQRLPSLLKLEHNVANVPWYDRCLDRPLDLRGDQLHLSQRPGLGVELDPAFLRGHRARGWPG